ncbi:hypothetical protein [Nocardia altamirensis]|uniref:hypothetical protein n=1 Tax=Nocardia altamirensis TaxID=472158 RepID=UPI00084077CB|nr:hypothetical protein [Nocardia altamirensis]
MDYYAIRNRLNRIVHEKLRADHGDTAITREPVVSTFTGYNFGDREVAADPLQAIKEADRIADVARSIANDYATDARSHGRGWDEIADAFGITTGKSDDPAIEAYQRVAGEGWSSTTSWRCACCAERVTDRGPWNPHPSDNESGHADDCARHQREISAYERRRDGYDQDRADGPDWDMDL